MGRKKRKLTKEGLTSEQARQRAWEMGIDKGLSRYRIIDLPAVKPEPEENPQTEMELAMMAEILPPGSSTMKQALREYYGMTEEPQ